jgi:MYXO-CTERM domain-containing protein
VKRGGIFVAALVLAASLADARPAGAYVRYTSSNGKMFKWPQTCIQLETFPTDLLEMMPSTEIIGAIDGSAASWSHSGDACTYLDIMVTTSTDPTPRATNDGHNLVIFRASNWCKLTDKGVCDPAVVYDAAALALTSVSASTSSGIIRDADIEVNAFHFSWADLAAHPEMRGSGMSYHDLQNAVTHEMGHLIGLDHTCYFQGPPPLDANGAPITDCASASADVLATTMFPSANPGDVDKRTLGPDDQQAVCEIYPAAEDPMVCSPPGSMPPDEGCSSCAAAGAAAGTTKSAAGLLALAVVVLLAMRARRRRS